MKKSLSWAVVFSVVFFVPLYFLTDWAQVPKIIKQISATYLLAGLGVFVLANLMRAVRFRSLDDSKQPLLFWWFVNHTYNFSTATLPGGAGEAVTVLALKRLSSYAMSSGIRVLLMTRIMDLAWFCVMLLQSLLFVGAVVTYIKPVVVLASVLLALSVVLLHPATEQLILRFSTRIVPTSFPYSVKIRESLEVLHKLSQRQREEGRHTKAIGQSALVIFGSAFSAHLTFLAIGIDFTWNQTLYCYGIYALFQLVPVQGIAGIGTQAAWWALALGAAGHQSDDLAALGILLHATFYLFIAVTGFFAFVIFLSVAVRKAKKHNRHQSTLIEDD